MPILPRFAKPADNSRPYGSRRYDVFAPKLNRTLTLFGRAALNAWVLLEADPDVVCYCERPLTIPDIKPKRVVDFWVKRRSRDEFLFLLRPSELDAGLGQPGSIPAFTTWAQQQDVALSFVDPADNEKRKFLLTNWGWIIRDLSAFGRFAPPALAEDLSKAIQSPTSFAGLERNFVEIDPILVRVAIYALLHQGRIKCQALEHGLLGSSTAVEPL
jgi:hypothetical protein